MVNKTLDERIASLERTVRRYRRIGTTSVGALLLLICLGAGLREGEVFRADTIETRELVILAEDGTRRAVLRPVASSAELVLLDEEGRQVTVLGEDDCSPSRMRLELETPDGGSASLESRPGSASLLMGAVKDRRGDVWVRCDKNKSAVYFSTVGHSTGAVIGVTEKDEAYGGFLSLTDSRLATTRDGQKVWAGNPTYFLVSPTKCVDRREKGPENKR